MVWDEETIRRLRDLWAQGLSTAEIGRRLSVSKNAIVGKAHRLDLDARPSPIRREPAKPGAERSLGCPRVAGPTLPPLASTSALPGAPPSHQPGFTPTEVRFGQRSAGGGQAAETPAGLRFETRHSAGQRLVGLIPGDSGRSAGAAGTRGETLPGEARAMHTGPADGSRPVPSVRVPTPVPRPVMPSVSIHARRPAPACCWPIGEPGTKTFRFCDDTAVPGKPYCDEHAKLAYVKARDRKEDAA
jgi:GcrA cell cycle regulator